MTAPAYVHEPPRSVADPDVEVWAGTEARIRVRANVPIRDPVLVASGEATTAEPGAESRTRMGIDSADDHCAHLTLTLTQPGRYRIELTDAWGYPNRHSRWNAIAIREDQPPAIRIVNPPLAAEPAVPPTETEPSRPD